MASFISGPSTGGAHKEGHETNEVPGAQRPKTRPPTSKRDKFGLFQRTLPKYSGPYSVGTMEIEGLSFGCRGT